MRVFALVNTTSDPQTQLATLYTPDEIAFVKRVLDAMFDTNNTYNKEVMAVKGMDALRLAKPSRERESAVGSTQNMQGTTAVGITQDRAEKLLGELVDEDRFEKSRAGFYSLSPRQLMELRGWLIETYNEEEEEWQRIKSCEGCKEIVTVVCIKLFFLHVWLESDASSIGVTMCESRMSVSISRLLCQCFLSHTCR